MQDRPDTNLTRRAAGFLVALSADHPGFRDALYRARRDELARQASAYESGAPLPHVDYTQDEQTLWQTLWQRLERLHHEHVCEALQAQRYGLDWSGGVPQLSELARELEPATGFRMEPVPGLVTPSVFFDALRRSVFLSTTYIRHPSRPFYTPEPDVVHEVAGHAASLMHPGIAAVSRAFGRAARRASDDELEALIRLYWYSVEFGLVRSGGKLRAWGAGLLSSVAELEGALAHERLIEWDAQRIMATPFEPTDFQPQLFVATSLDDVLAALARLLD